MLLGFCNITGYINHKYTEMVVLILKASFPSYGRGAAPAAQGVMGTTPDPRASLAVRAPPVLASVQGQGSEAAAVRVRKEE